jgi:hypothetical protein
MRKYKMIFWLVMIFAAIAAGQSDAQQAPCDAKPTNGSKISMDGTAYVTRIVPVPNTVSPEAQEPFARVESDANVPTTLEQRRSGTDRWQAGVGERFKQLYPVILTAGTIAGVPVRIVSPLAIVPEKRDRVLINLTAADSIPIPDRFPKRFPSPIFPESKLSQCSIVSHPNIPSLPDSTTPLPFTWNC